MKENPTLALWEERGVALCSEAQADGVPCEESGRKCEQCANAVRALRELEAALAAKSNHPSPPPGRPEGA